MNHVSSWKSKLLKNAYKSLKGLLTLIMSHLLTVVKALTLRELTMKNIFSQHLLQHMFVDVKINILINSQCIN